jgi:hypothetical protein
VTIVEERYVSTTNLVRHYTTLHNTPVHSIELCVLPVADCLVRDERNGTAWKVERERQHTTNNYATRC